MHLESYNCVLCLDDNEGTTLQHIFLDCDFAKLCFGPLNLQYPNN
jgi:hypothetical protein